MIGRRRWSWVAYLVTLALLAIVTIQYVDYQRRRDDARWCALLVPLDEAYQATPPQTQTGRDVAAAIHQQRQQFGC